MTRVPLRPLARILRARTLGENPDTIERENLRLRHEQMRDKSRGQAQLRLVILILCFFSAFTLIGGRMGMLASTEPVEPRSSAGGDAIASGRADIEDRNGHVLATNMQTNALYVQTRDLVDPRRVATELSQIFPDLDAETLHRRFTDGRSFMWVRKVLSPEQVQAVHEIGDPGLLFGPREMRLYPNGTLAAHVLGGSSFGAEGVGSAQIIGTAGIEKFMDSRLSDPEQAGRPLRLSLDMTVQAHVEELLETGVNMYSARGGAVILMNIKTGEILSMASMPTFDPNDRPNPLVKGEPGDSPLFNRAVQGLYELGSTYKIFAAAQAMDLGLLNADSPVDTSFLKIGSKTISEYDGHNYGPTKTLSEVIEVSSNIGSGHIALMIGAERQQAFLRSLGLFSSSPVELIEAMGAKPQYPKKWPDIVTVTAAYGHGVSSSPLNLATAYATIANGGVTVKPTLLAQADPTPGDRVMSAYAAEESVNMLRRVVVSGTAKMADIPGYEVAGKTGTADKPSPSGGYYDDKVINTFAAVFPASHPEYVLVVNLDEPVETSGSKPLRTAGWTAVPLAAEIIKRAAPLLGMRPVVEPAGTDALTAVKQ